MLLSTLYALPSTLHAVEIKPVINAELLGGQYFYNGHDNSLGGYASLVASPYTKFNEQWSLVPLYAGDYKGTQQVQDLIGGGTLFQDSQNHDASLKVIRSFGNGLKLKAIGAYGVELLRETKDEAWTKGLYDNHKLSAGTEAEWSWAQERFVRLDYDYYAIRFPNYTSLESQGTTQGLGRELNAPDVLDTHNHAVTLGTRLGLPGNGFFDASASYTWSAFPSEHVVDISGSLIGELREDQTERLLFKGTWPVLVDADLRFFSALSYSFSHVYSNQNHYDAQALFFNPDYYAYTQQTLANEWTLAVGDDPWTLSFSWALTRQKYADRLIQDASGAYGTDVTFVNGASTSLEFTYPIAKNFHLVAQGQFGWSNSNNEDNAVYQYHYNTQSYLAGLRYAY